MREIKKEVVYDFIENFINSQKMNLPKELEKFRQEAIRDNIPIIKPDVINLMQVMLKLKNPASILEVGTAYAFSAILMLQHDSVKNITTIERDARMAKHARENLEKYDVNKSISLLEGDGVECLKKLNEKFDLVFIDASKSHYNEFMKEAKRLLADGGIIIADNVLYKGLVAKEREEVIRRDRTIHKRMREFIKDAFDDTNFSTCLMPVGDGILMSIKNKVNS